MATYKLPGPICQFWNWEDIIDGTLARAPSPSPQMIGASDSDSATANPAATTGGCPYLNPRSTGTVRAPQTAFDHLRNSSSSARTTNPQQIASHSWSGGTSTPAIEQNIQIGNQTIRVVRPTDSAARGKNLPATSQVAEALRAIPSNQRTHTSTVILSPIAHPDSTTGHTVAGAAGSGVITLYPVSSTQSQNDFDNRFMHESAHNYQGHLWNSGAAVAEWGAAARSDGRLPSPYAGENTGDDFCEFLILYNASRGTPCEATARHLYQHRWQKMTEYQSR